jgi:hypothetical protein
LLGVNETQGGQTASQSGSTANHAASFLDTLMRDVVSALGIRNSLAGILTFICLVFLLKGLLKFAEGAYKSYLQAVLQQQVQTRLVNAYSTMAFVSTLVITLDNSRT